MTQPVIPLSYANPADTDHLKLLAIFSYIASGLAALSSLLGIVYIFLGAAVMKTPSMMGPTPAANNGLPPEMFGWFFIVFGVFMMILLLTIAALNFFSARSMQQRKRRVLSIVVAGLNCMQFPLGTALGVFSLIVLLRQSVIDLYNNEAMHNRP